MSSAIAIASVSYLLKDLLNDELINNDVSSKLGATVTVTAVPPDTLVLTDKNIPSRLNLYMYLATPNPGWRNAAFPCRDSRGDLLSNPPLALDLHYLLTAYGFSELHSEILLGYGMQLMHEMPVIPRDLIRKSLAAQVEDPQIPPGPLSPLSEKSSTVGSLPDSLKKLAKSGLADQVEQIKISFQPMSTDEMSKLWSAFQSKYRPSAAYTVSVVLIQREKCLKSALPVKAVNFAVKPFRQPTLREVSPQIVSSGELLTLRGSSLAAPLLKVLFGDTEVVPAAEKVSDDKIEIPVPDTLVAGVNTVKVVHEVDLGTKQEPHHGYQSNCGVFLLRPGITFKVAVGIRKTFNGVDYCSGKLTVEFATEVGRSQKVTLKLNQVNGGSGARAYVISAPAANGVDSNLKATKQVEFTFEDVVRGKYLVRVEVDGAESELGVDKISQQYDSPEALIS